MRPNYQGQKPEAALQRAHDFLSVGKQKDALQALHDLIKDRRHKQWTQTYEQIMLLYIELCVNLRNSALVKDGLYQYKIITQQVSVKSLESVLEKFLQLAEQKALEAQKHSIEKIDEIDDLDVADAPENLLLSVSGAVAQDRMDRTVLSPWLRFLWDAYRNCLDLLRNNVYVESLYHQIARQSFAFCTKYQRRNEFRKLCEMLRQHLVQIQKAQLSTAMHPIRLSNTESLGHMLETRLIQLDTAINMDLWQEAFKSAEDLHGFMQLVKEKDKKIIRPTSYANYYDKISMVFWKGGNTLFHAAALLQRFCIYKDMRRQFADEDAMDQATRVLLATLSIPEGAEGASLLAKHLDIEEQHLANVRVLSSLLRLPITPSRSGIIKEIVRLNIPELASPAAYELYKCVEMEFNPLRIAPNVQKHLADIDKLGHVEYSQYAESVKSVVTTRILKKLSALYETLSLKRLQKLIPFYDPIELEQKLVNVCKQQSLKARVDHRSECIRFGHMEIALANDLESEMETNVTEVEKARTHLDELYTQLGNIQLQFDAQQLSQMQEKLKRQIFVYMHQKDADFERVLARRKRIELHKENTEQVRREKLQKEQAHANKQEELRRRDELKKLQEENKENEKRRKLNEQEELQRKLNSEKLKKYQVHPFYQQLVKEHGEEIFESGDPDQLIKEKRLRFDAERREQQTKLQNQEKKYDHTVRAFHFEEMALWKELSEERQKTFPEMHEVYETKRIEEAIKEHERSFETYACLVKAKEDAKEFMRSVIQSHADEFKDQKVAWKQRVDETRKKLLKERAERRKEQRKKEAKEAEMRKQQEEQRRLEDEKRVADQQKREQQQPKRQQQPEETTVRRREQAVVGGGASGEQMWRSEKPAAAAAVEKRPVPVARDEQQQRQPLQVPQKAKYVPPSMRNK